jgi:alkylation response protein AidB-like acyl-CoA dehydrogenase
VTQKTLNARDMDFIVYEMLEAEALTARARFAEHNRETFDAALATARLVAEKHFANHNRKGDEHEPAFDGKSVTLIPEIRAACDAVIASGLTRAGRDYELGGMQLPHLLAQACFAWIQAANVSSSVYAFLAQSAGNVIEKFGSDEQKRKFFEPMNAGRYYGTMCLTEPHAGSSLGDMRATAERQPDGTYRVRASKIFISAGEHDLGENIVHLVLAKARKADGSTEPGVKGISLFIVPKFLVNDDGSLGARNDVHLAGLFHKMGYRSSISTAMNFGENEGATGYLLGEEGKGLACMFHMMNEARIAVGTGAAVLAVAGYLESLAYARNRPQGRSPDNRDPRSPMLPISEHADVRRMLLEQKALAEGALALCLYSARLVDDMHTHPEESERRHAAALLDLLTPIIKAWPSEYGPKANDLAIQIHGGAGYTREYIVEQHYRDNRLNPIHEGTNGIQSLDLLGRKLALNGGATFRELLARMQATATQAGEHEETRELGTALTTAVQRLAQVAMFFATQRDVPPSRLTADAALFLDFMSRVVIAWIWCWQANVAARALTGGNAADAGFYRGKLQAARYYIRRELPRTQEQARLLMALDDTVVTMVDGWF